LLPGFNTFGTFPNIVRFWAREKSCSGYVAAAVTYRPVSMFGLNVAIMFTSSKTQLFNT